MGRFKYFLWWLGFNQNVCPYCGSKTAMHYSSTKSIDGEYYTCTKDDCEFNGDKQ